MYNCACGFPYAIGECGGAMVVATCPQCGAEIGGTRHRILDGNVPNPRMDGTGSCSIYGLLCSVSDRIPMSSVVM